MDLRDLFPAPRPIIGSIALSPLPGSPRFGGDLDAVVAIALEDARALEAGGVDGLSLENMGDAPFFKSGVPPETVASIGRVLAELRRRTELPIGVNVLRNDGRAALSIAQAFGGAFIRVNVLTEAHVTDQGIIEGIGAELMRVRRLIGADRIAVFADVHVKHATPMLQRPIRESALDLVERGLADVLVVSGTRTGLPPSAEDLAEAGRAGSVVIGSGLTAENAGALLAAADGAIVASTFRPDGDLAMRVDPDRVARFMEVVRGVRSAQAT
jgi:membrane complex biogenesis BtpA family protein